MEQTTIANNAAKAKRATGFRTTEFSLLMIILALGVFFTLATDSFFTNYNLSNLLKQASITGIIAVASTLVIISGGIDLSVGSITGMGSLIVALAMSRAALPTMVAILLALIAGAALGLFNGLFIHEFKIAPFIATLGTQIIIRGIIKIISDSKTIVGIYPEFAAFSDARLLGIPYMAIIWLLISLLVFLILKFTKFGRNIFVIGCGEEVALLSGINLRVNTYGIYILSGALCAIAGAMLTARINSAIPTGGAGYEMNSIAAAVIGGASLSGGRGSIIGTLFGTFLMVLINNGGIQMGIDPFVMDVSTGILILLAVIIDNFRVKKK